MIKKVFLQGMIMSSIGLSAISYAAITQTAETFFSKWAKPTGEPAHYVFQDRDLLLTGQDRLAGIRQRLGLAIEPNQPLRMVLAHKNAEALLDQLYASLCSTAGVGNFIKLIQQEGLSSDSINEQECLAYFKTVLNKYIAFMEGLLYSDQEFEQRERLFTVANNFFEYCFCMPTYPMFKNFLETSEYYPLLRLFYTTIWNNLAGIGWKDWHVSCLEALATQARQGKEVVYIAGGCDLYYLLQHGVYNIRVIDPMLPTQPRYYVTDWSWFIRGMAPGNGIGDKLVFNLPQGKITMKRVGFKEFDDKITLNGDDGSPISVNKSVTGWLVYDAKNQKIGQVTFERRLCQQHDFVADPRRVLLLSFNELYYITCVGQKDWWGIDPNMFTNNFQVYVKQLRKPVGKHVMLHMSYADSSPFQFIKLGTCVK